MKLKLATFGPDGEPLPESILEAGDQRAARDEEARRLQALRDAIDYARRFTRPVPPEELSQQRRRDRGRQSASRR